MLEVPKRTSLVAAVADNLRRAMKHGEWFVSLPGQRLLADRLQVSRVTVQKAMKLLRREGLLEVSIGRRSRILLRSRRRTTATSTGIVGALVEQPAHLMQPSSIFLITELQRHLHDAGFELRTYCDPRLLASHPRKRLERLVVETRAAGWVLFSVNFGVQD